eukprot:1157367-Pelagomonas_calceolata.AAC.8
MQVLLPCEPHQREGNLQVKRISTAVALDTWQLLCVGRDQEIHCQVRSLGRKESNFRMKGSQSSLQGDKDLALVSPRLDLQNRTACICREAAIVSCDLG